MQTRGTNTLKQKSDPDRFEKTVNLLLTQVRKDVFKPYEFELRVDKPFTDPNFRKQLSLKKGVQFSKLPMIHVKERKDKTKSRPDAELVQVPISKQSILNEVKRDRMHFVIDAKYYQGQLSSNTIDKTLDDMALRKAKGLIICSEETQISESIEVNYQKLKGTLQIILLKKGTTPDSKLKELMLADEERFFMPDYLTQENLKIIIVAIQRFVKLYEEQDKVESAKGLFKALDDTYLEYSSQLNQEQKQAKSKLTDILQMSQLTLNDEPKQKVVRNKSSSNLLKDIDFERLQLNANTENSKQEETKVEESKEQYIPELRDQPAPKPEWLLKKIADSQFEDEKDLALLERVERIVLDLLTCPPQIVPQIYARYNLRLTKQGTLDKRIKENKLILKALDPSFNSQQDSTSQKSTFHYLSQQSKASETSAGNVFYRGMQIPVTTSGKPNMRYKICKEVFQKESDVEAFMKFNQAQSQKAGKQ